MVTDGEEVPEELYNQLCAMFELDPKEGFALEDLHAMYTVCAPMIGADICTDFRKIFGDEELLLGESGELFEVKDEDVLGAGSGVGGEDDTGSVD